MYRIHCSWHHHFGAAHRHSHEYLRFGSSSSDRRGMATAWKLHTSARRQNLWSKINVANFFNSSALQEMNYCYANFIMNFYLWLNYMRLLCRFWRMCAYGVRSFAGRNSAKKNIMSFPDRTDSFMALKYDLPVGKVFLQSFLWKLARVISCERVDHSDW